MRTFSTVVIGAAALLAATAAFAQMAPTKTGDSAKGKVLTDAKGMTLYTFDKDAGGKSACNGPCATNWPPLMADNAAKPMAGYTVVVRDDGGKQWAHKGKPLYTYKSDANAGDVTGNGRGKWAIAVP